jgi:hypothetical protein
METKVTSPVLKGLLIALLLIVISVVSYATNQSDASWNKWASNIILLGGIIVSCIIYANQNNGNVTFGNVFANGFKTGAVVTCLMIVFTVLFITLKPEIKELAMEKAREGMAQKQNVSEADAEKGMEIMSKFFYPIMIGAILLMDLVMSVIGALIGAAVAKKNPNQNPF